MDPHEEDVKASSVKDDVLSAMDDTELEAAPEPEIEEVEPALTPPDRWSPEYKETFASLSDWENGRTVQQGMLDYHKMTQGEITKLGQERAEYNKQLEEWNNAVTPYQEMLMHSGLTPQQFFMQGAGLMSALGGPNSQETLKRLAQQTGNESMLAAVNGSDEYVLPETQAVMEENRQMREELNELRQYQHSMNQQFQRQQDQATTDQITSFAEAKDENGNLKHPHFDQVRVFMGRLLMGDKQNPPVAANMEEAYTKSLNAFPELVAQQNADKELQEVARKAAKAKKERDAADRPSGTTSGEDKPVDKGLKPAVEAAFETHSA